MRAVITRHSAVLLQNDDAAVFEAISPVAADKPLLDRHFVRRKLQGNWLLCFTSRKQRQCRDQGKRRGTSCRTLSLGPDFIPQSHNKSGDQGDG